MLKRLRTWGRQLYLWLRMESKQREEYARKRRILRQCFERHPKALEILRDEFGHTANSIAATDSAQRTGFKLGQQSIIEELDRVMENELNE